MSPRKGISWGIPYVMRPGKTDIKQAKMSQGRGSPKIMLKILSFSRLPNSGRMHPIYNSGRPHAELDGWPSSLSDLKEIGCKSVWLVYISPLFRPIEQLLALKIAPNLSSPSHIFASILQVRQAASDDPPLERRDSSRRRTLFASPEGSER